jgi:predicted type IV restriction endonuclease
MFSVPSRVSERIVTSLKKFQPIIQSAKTRDVNESDTVIIVTDMMSDLFGYDKYSELTSEFAVRSTYCDLATKIDGHVQCLIEVKAVGTELKDNHTKQAVDYAANQGIEWVALTNGEFWKIYKVTFTKPIGQELVIEFNILSFNHKKPQDIEALFLLAKEGFQKSALGEFSAQRQALNRFWIAAMLLTDSVLDVVRRELRRMSPDVRIDTEQIKAVMVQEILKRDVIEGDKAEEAHRKVVKAAGRMLRTRAASASQDNGSSTDTTTEAAET